MYTVPEFIDEGNQVFRLREEATYLETSEVLTIDASPPVLSSPMIEEAREGSPIVVRVDVSDTYGMRSVQLEWSIAGGGNGSVSMIGGSTGAYAATIPAPSRTGELELRVTAVDFAGNAATTTLVRVPIGPGETPAPPSVDPLALTAAALAAAALIASFLALLRMGRTRKSPPLPPTG